MAPTLTKQQQPPCARPPSGDTAEEGASDKGAPTFVSPHRCDLVAAMKTAVETKGRLRIRTLPLSGARFFSKEQGVHSVDKVVVADKALCAWMFDVLVRHFEPSAEAEKPPLSAQRMASQGATTPAFVTWMKRRSDRHGYGEGDVDLRGCIGSLEPIPILRLGHYALLSALEDSRFNPVKESEIPDLKCHVSLLHTFEPVRSVYDWDVGRHGITISFVASGRSGLRTYKATYLPEVAAETGMSREETLVSLVRKAGYMQGPVDEELLGRVSLTRYQTSQTRLDYPAYVEEFGHTARRHKHKPC